MPDRQPQKHLPFPEKLQPLGKEGVCERQGVGGRGPISKLRMTNYI